MASSYSFTFTTSDGTGPSVSTVTPSDNSTDQSVLPSIQISFNEAMDQSTLTSTNITVEDSSSDTVSGTISYTAGTMTATFTPSCSLHYDEDYTVTVGTGVTDAAGNNLASSKTCTFTTRGRDWTIMMYMDAGCDL
ncbi:MAG: Ig-like domain-containing protein, partial [Spirochaetota bacterium]